MSLQRRPTPRRVVLLWAVVAVLTVLGIVRVTNALRHNHVVVPAISDVEPPAFDPLRDDVECTLPSGREGEQREEAQAEPALPQPISSTELLDCPQTWDGRRVAFTGEVVGAILHQGDHVWTQVNDDAYGMLGEPLPSTRGFAGANSGVGVRLDPLMVTQVQVVGGPGVIGDLVEVVGVFQRVDEPTGEVAVIVAEQLRRVRDGGPAEIPGAPGRMVAALLAAAVAAAAVVLERRTRNRR